MKNYISFIFILIFLPSFLSAQDYNVIDLGTDSSGHAIYGRAINDNGEVCGYIPGSGAVIWKDGSYNLYTDFGIFEDINNKGQVVGSKYLAEGKRGFIFDSDTTIFIGTFGGSASSAQGINDSGWVTGSADGSSPFNYNAYIYKNGSLKNISSLEGRAEGYKINNLGHIVGSLYSTSGFFYNGSTKIEVDTLPGYPTPVAVNLNDNDKVVGWLYGRDGSPHPMLWNGISSLLPSIGSTGQANAINNDDIIVGTAFGNNTALIWKNNSVTDLNTLITSQPGLYLTNAHDINNNGQILCEATLNGNTRYVILDPFSTDLIVNTTGDESDYDINDGICDADPNTPGNQCTLRAAIENANHNPGKDIIAFDIPGNDIPKINILSPLPAITGEVEINGLTQK